MVPILFRVGEIAISSSIFFLVLGALLGIAVGWIEARRVGIPDRIFHGYWVSAVPLALLLAAINGWIFEVDPAEGLRSIARADHAGLVSFGAIFGALSWAYGRARIKKRSAGLALDTLSLALPVILGVYRIGCVLSGCCYGLETDGLLAVNLPGRDGVWEPRYPTQLMLLLFNLALFVWLWQRRKRKSFEGHQALRYLLAYASGRLIIDAFRDLPRVLGPFSLHQLTSIAILLIASYIAFQKLHGRRAAAG